ncbi:unnamed protein product [Paramecium primaurelia]|uniref:Zinc transporter n=1 Tax=Paramecium primaurelia TaxID=5886 RepID=A0A8S1NV59_PARPR|nr:unnamed protein product [Paramecium primaurelia]
MNKEEEPIQEPLINDGNQQTKGKSNRGMSQLSALTEQSKNETHLYEIPDLSNVTQNVLCRLIAVSVVCIVFLIAEVVGGLWAQSLAILSDAAHMFSDMSGFFISIFSIWLSQRPASQKMSFGYHRAEVIGALASIVLIWGLTILLLYEATERMINKSLVTEPLIMLITAGFGLFCNLVMAKVLHSSPTGGHDHGNIMHQCSGHHHGHDHNHEHNHEHEHDHHEGEKKKQKKKYHVKQKRSMVSENGVSMLVVEQSIESDSNNSKSNKTIEEVSSESKQTSNGKQNYSQQQIIQQQNQKEILDHNHSENCDHDHDHSIQIGSDEFVSQNNTSKKMDNKNNSDHNHSCSHDHHDHSDSDSHEHNHHDHDHDHHHHDRDELTKKRNKKLKNHNLSEINEHDNYNLKAAMIHVIGDILQSIGVLIAALLIYFFGQEKDENHQIIFTYWQYADPLCTYLFSILVLFTTFGVAKECLRVLMEGTPTNLIIEEFRDKLNAIHRVREVHDLHIWSLSVGKPAMSAHIVCIENPEYVLKKATKLCRKFGIYHSTIQIELLDRQGANDYIKCNHNLHK